MKKFLSKMIIPTIILGWATYYIISVLKFKPLNLVLIRPVYFVMLGLYIINGVIDYFACRKEEKMKNVAANTAESKEKRSFVEVVKELAAAKQSKIVYIFIMILLYALLLKPVGFIIVNLLFLFGVLFVMGERKVWKLIAIPIVVTAAMYMVFVVGLKILLPAGILKGLI